MIIRRLYLSEDGRQFHSRREAVNYENDIKNMANERDRNRRREERLREKQRVREIKREAKENELRTRLHETFGDTIAPAINLMIQNRTRIKQLLTVRR